MKNVMPLLTTALLLSTGAALSVQTSHAEEHETAKAKAKAKAAVSNADVTYGRVKEFTAGQKIVLNIDNAPDKSFDLADKDLAVKIGKGLKVGDPVKINEHSVMGKTKSVAISKHTGGGVTHGEPHPVTK